jgi:cytoskeletal protein CcmA (bactofilin family)
VSPAAVEAPRPTALAITPAPVPAPAAAPLPSRADLPAHHACVISSGTVIEGTVRTAGGLRIEGLVTGGAQADHVTVEQNGRVEGSIEALTVTVAGQVQGSIAARDIEVLRPARIEGELSYVDIAIERGARVRGVHRQHDESPVSPAVAAAAAAAAPLASAPRAAEGGGVVIGLDDLKSRIARLGAQIEAETAAEARPANGNGASAAKAGE